VLDLPIADGAIDVALAMHMLYHLEDVPKGVAEIRRAVKPGGILYALTNSHQDMPELTAVYRACGLQRVEGMGGSAFTAENGAGTLAIAFTDVVHFDLGAANVLHRDGRLAAVIDWNVPFTGAGQGDRGVNVATLLFYDNAATRGALWERALEISGPRWTAVHLAHLVLRQVEWTRRHRPDGDEERRSIAVAHRVLADCECIM
jgi:SAM-dependent methyltransferase